MKKNHFPNFKQRRREVQNISEARKPEILRAVAALTPEACPECSSTEVAGHIHERFSAHDVHVIGCLLGVYKSEGLVENRKIYRIALWKLTDAGRAYVRKLKSEDRSR